MTLNYFSQHFYLIQGFLESTVCLFRQSVGTSVIELPDPLLNIGLPELCELLQFIGFDCLLYGRVIAHHPIS